MKVEERTPHKEPDDIVLADRRKRAPVVRIRPATGWIPLNLAELWEYRELVYFLTWRDIRARYRQTVLGAAWAIIQPLMTMVVFSLLFGRLARIPSDGLPYPIFAFAALVPWTFFAHALNQSANSLVSSAHLIKKVYFPRIIVPTAAVLGGLVDFALAFVVLLVMMLYFGRLPTLDALWLPAFVLLAMGAALGMGFWLSTLNVAFRDIRYAVPFLTQLWLFATPIAYPRSVLAEPWRTLSGLNPMAGVVEGFRWALLGTSTAPGPIVVLSAIGTLALIVSGAFYLRRMEKTLADIT